MLTQFARIERRNVGPRSRPVTVAEAGEVSGTSLATTSKGLFFTRLRFEATGSTPAVFTVRLHQSDLLAVLRTMLYRPERPVMGPLWDEAQAALAIDIAAVLDAYNAACLRAGK